MAGVSLRKGSLGPKKYAFLGAIVFSLVLAVGCGGSSVSTVAPPPPQPIETVLYSFNTANTNADGQDPESGLIADNSGNFYGTALRGGGSPSCGIAYKLSASGQETILYSFQGKPDGCNPIGGLVRDSSGNLYGTTTAGGTFDSGAVFKLDSSGNETVLHSFAGAQNGDGENPVAGLILDSLGNLYGTTALNTTNCSPSVGCGTVFKVDAVGNETVLYSFTGMNGDGGYPLAPLIIDAAGNLYGTSFNGGLSSPCVTKLFTLTGCGTIFKLDTSGHETVLYTFSGTNGDGIGPGKLTMDASGNLYGAAEFGGSSGFGIIFKLDTSLHETVLYTFSGGTDGAFPHGGLTIDSAGNLYGTTVGTLATGPAQGLGSAFVLDPSGHLTVLHDFSGSTSDGASPWGGLIMDSAGNLFGTTGSGGAGQCKAPPPTGCGTVFKIH